MLSIEGYRLNTRFNGFKRVYVVMSDGLRSIALRYMDNYRNLSK